MHSLLTNRDGNSALSGKWPQRWWTYVTILHVTILWTLTSSSCLVVSSCQLTILLNIIRPLNRCSRHSNTETHIKAKRQEWEVQRERKTQGVQTLTSIQSMMSSLSTSLSFSSRDSSLYCESEPEGAPDADNSSADLTATGRSRTVNSTFYTTYTHTPCFHPKAHLCIVMTTNFHRIKYLVNDHINQQATAYTCHITESMEKFYGNKRWKVAQ